jgi:hypothetical protein
MTASPENLVRLDNLARNLDDQPGRGETASVAVIALVLLAVVLFEMLLILPAAVSIANS